MARSMETVTGQIIPIPPARHFPPPNHDSRHASGKQRCIATKD
jgi:hypothetical protein